MEHDSRRRDGDPTGHCSKFSHQLENDTFFTYAPNLLESLCLVKNNVCLNGERLPSEALHAQPVESLSRFGNVTV